MKKIILALLLLLPLAAQAVEWQGRVIAVHDGDTLTVLTPQKTQVKIRLAEIDAPETNQSFGAQSKKSLSDICYSKTVKVDDRGKYSYGRLIARLYCDGVDANAAQVQRGMAWAYTRYLTDDGIASLEISARKFNSGLWSEKSPLPPWEFRHNMN